jgi:hypothetical protein
MMNRNLPHELLDKELITQDQFEKIEVITSGKVVSVFYELRTMLYLGVMLFTTGAGMLVYQNIGDIGHLISISLLTLLMIGCFWYVVKHEVGYSNGSITSPTPYYDYVLLLGCLLFVSIQGYLQFQYGALYEYLGWSTLITAVFFFYAAYRFDHLGVLSLAITALASFWSISVSPQKWYSGDFLTESNLYNTAIIFAAIITAIAFILDWKKIKPHFTFTYFNFCALIYFVGCVVGLFMGVWFLYVLLIYAGCGFTWYIARSRRSFLFLLYAFLAGYIGTTYLLAETIFVAEPMLWFYYSILSCGGFVFFIIRYKNFFKQ